MSSLLQFGGKMSSRGVHLEAYQTTPSEKFMLNYDGTKNFYLKDSESCGDITDCVYLPGGKVLSRIWTFARKPRGMFGCWVVFKFNGKEHVPDLSCPMGLFKLPRDAKPLPIDECITRWNS